MYTSHYRAFYQHHILSNFLDCIQQIHQRPMKEDLFSLVLSSNVFWQGQCKSKIAGKLFEILIERGLQKMNKTEWEVSQTTIFELYPDKQPQDHIYSQNEFVKKFTLEAAS